MSERIDLEDMKASIRRGFPTDNYWVSLLITELEQTRQALAASEEARAQAITDLKVANNAVTSMVVGLQRLTRENDRLAAQVEQLRAELDTAASRMEDCEQQTKLAGGKYFLRPFARWAKEIRSVLDAAK